MIPTDIQGVDCFSFTPEKPVVFPTLMPNAIPALQYSTVLTSFPSYQQASVLPEFMPNSGCISSNSASDEAEDNPVHVIDERKQRRMISNRESARRSRIRKQRHLDELWLQVLHLREENQCLMSKLNEMTESYDKVVLENAQLKEEASNLHQMLEDLQINNCYTFFSDLDDIPCNAAHLRAESSSQSDATSVALLN